MTSPTDPVRAPPLDVSLFERHAPRVPASAWRACIHTARFSARGPKTGRNTARKRADFAARTGKGIACPGGEIGPDRPKFVALEDSTPGRTGQTICMICCFGGFAIVAFAWRAQRPRGVRVACARRCRGVLRGRVAMSLRSHRPSGVPVTFSQAARRPQKPRFWEIRA